MSYRYEAEKNGIFTEQGQRRFLEIRDHAHKLLTEGGAFMMSHVLRDAGWDWQMLACVDRLVELGEIREITLPGTAGQYRVFVSA